MSSESADKVSKSVAKKVMPKGGSRKGIPNKVSGDLRAMIMGALDAAGGQAYLQKQADENPNAFMALIGKTLPKEVTGKDGKDLFPTKIKIELVNP